MKKYGCLLAAALTVAGCMSPSGAPDNTASGALAGGAAGAILGSINRDHGAGAAVGGLLGAAVGGIIGHGLDQAQQARLNAQSPQTLLRIEQGGALTVADVKALVNAGIGDDLIVSQIRNTRTVYHLNATEIIDLKSAGAGEKVIDFMINTPTRGLSAREEGSVQPEPRRELIVASPGPGYVWIAGAWLWFGDHWVWHGGYWHRPGRAPGHVPRP